MPTNHRDAYRGLDRLPAMGKTFEVSCRRLIRLFDREMVCLEIRLDPCVEQESEWDTKKDVLLRAPGAG